jgi:hypothetical protein
MFIYTQGIRLFGSYDTHAVYCDFLLMETLSTAEVVQSAAF